VNGRARVVVTLERGILEYQSNVDGTGTIALLDAAHHLALNQSLGGVGGMAEAPGGSRRAPGLAVRRVDQGP